MSTYHQLILPDETVIYIKEYSSTQILEKSFDTYLTEEEIEKVKSFKSDYRKIEFISARELLKKHLPNEKISYATTGAPQIEKGKISISHSKGIVCLAIHPNYIVGIDVEYKSSRAQKVISKFLSQEEEDCFGNINDDLATILWCAKECMYKIGHTKAIDFKNEIRLTPTETENELFGSIRTRKGFLRTKLNVHHLKDHILVVGTLLENIG